MDNHSPGPMTPFDELITTPQLQLMKLMIPYAPVRGRYAMAACVKFMELRETLQLFSQKHTGIQAQILKGGDVASPFEMLDSFRPYLGPQETAALDRVIQLRDIMSVMEMMQNYNDAGTAGEERSGFDPMELLAGMLAPEQQEMFRMYSEMFSQPTESCEKDSDTTPAEEPDSGSQSESSENMQTESVKTSGKEMR